MQAVEGLKQAKVQLIELAREMADAERASRLLEQRREELEACADGAGWRFGADARQQRNTPAPLAGCGITQLLVAIVVARRC